MADAGAVEPVEVAVRLFAAIEAGDLEGVRAVYSPDAEIWHNTDGQVQSPDENLRTLRWVITHLTDRSYDDVRRAPTPEGFVQQHVLRATRADGRRVELAACIVCRCEAGQITRLDEYLDSAQLARILEP